MNITINWLGWLILVYIFGVFVWAIATVGWVAVKVIQCPATPSQKMAYEKGEEIWRFFFAVFCGAFFAPFWPILIIGGLLVYFLFPSRGIL